MKKWKIYLPLLSLCGALAVTGGIWGVMRGSTWNGQMELRHLEGDESALADFDIQLGITNMRQRWNFSIKDGALQKESFILSEEESFYGLGEPVGNWKDSTMEIWGNDVEFQPAADGKVENLDTVDLSLLENDDYISPELYDQEGNLHGTTCIFEKAQVVLNIEMEAVQNKNRILRSWSYAIPTHLQYIPEKPLVNITLKNEQYTMEKQNHRLNNIDVIQVWSESQEMLYATVRTNADCSGSIGLYCLGPRQEESVKDGNYTAYSVKKEPVATLAEIPVSESRWVLGLEDVGEGLLVFIGEPDGVTLELYGYDGTLLDSNQMQTEEPVHEVNIQQTKWKDGRGVFVEGSQKTGEIEYYVHFFTGYWIENGTIQPVYLNGDYGTWTAVGKEKVLVMHRKVDEWDGKAVPVWGNTMNGYEIYLYDITEDPAGKEIYRGELETDIDEDALKYFNYFTTKASKQSVEHQMLNSTSSSRWLEVLSVSENTSDAV